MWAGAYNAYLFFIYLFFLEFSPLIAYLYRWFETYTNVETLWAELCLRFAQCRVIFVEKSHYLASYEPTGCLFLANRVDRGEHLYTSVIDTYLTDGRALICAPYSYITYCFNEIIQKPDRVDIYDTLTKSHYTNLVVYPDMHLKIKPLSLYITMAWSTQMSIQIIITQNKEQVLDLKNTVANAGINLYCYRSEVIRPKYFNSFEEFSEYVELIWSEQLPVSKPVCT